MSIGSKNSMVSRHSRNSIVQPQTVSNVTKNINNKLQTN
jgi:hypothetical protein